MKRIILWSAAAVTVIAMILGVWYFTPKTFLAEIDPSEVASISVFDGSTGNHFTLTDSGEIRTVVENIKSVPTERGKLSLGYMGYSFRMSFIDEDGREIDSFILNGKDTIRDDPFFYYSDDPEDEFCFEYMKELEEKHCPRE